MAICINLQLPIVIFKKSILLDMHHHITYIRPILRSIGLLDIEILRKEVISTDDRRTDGQTSRTTTIGSFLKKRKKLLKTLLTAAATANIPSTVNNRKIYCIRIFSSQIIMIKVNRQ